MLLKVSGIDLAAKNDKLSLTNSGTPIIPASHLSGGYVNTTRTTIEFRRCRRDSNNYFVIVTGRKERIHFSEQEWHSRGAEIDGNQSTSNA